MFEADASVFQRAGIQVGADILETEKELQIEALDAFNIRLRSDAL